MAIGISGGIGGAYPAAASTARMKTMKSAAKHHIVKIMAKHGIKAKKYGAARMAGSAHHQRRVLRSMRQKHQNQRRRMAIRTTPHCTSYRVLWHTDSHRRTLRQRQLPRSCHHRDARGISSCTINYHRANIVASASTGSMIVRVPGAVNSRRGNRMAKISKMASSIMAWRRFVNGMAGINNNSVTINQRHGAK